MEAQKNGPLPNGTSLEGRLLLLENGYEPIPICGKAPHWQGWRHSSITPELLEGVGSARHDHKNTGLRTGRLCVVDVDLWEPEHAETVAESVQQILGASRVQRAGQKGVAICYFNPEPIGKITITGREPNGDKSKTLVEFLGQGQQLAAFGNHPDTGKLFNWTNAHAGGDPLSMPLEQLPKVCPVAIREAAETVLNDLNELGYTDVRMSDSGASRVESRTTSNGEPVTVGMLEETLSYVDPSCDRHNWIAIAGALKSANVIDLATGDLDETFDGAELFDRWSGGELNSDHEPGNYEGRGDCDAAYDSLSATRTNGAGVATLIHHARGGGYGGPSSIPAIERFRGLAKVVEQGVNDNREPITVRPNFINNKSGGLAKTFPNALMAAHHMEAIPELDEFNHRVVFRGDVPWSSKYGRVFDDDLLRAIRVHFLSEYQLDMTKENVSEAVLTVAASNRFHPVREYLEKLEWDGTERIDTWLTDHFGAADTPYVRAVARKTLVGAVGRIFQPGIKFDTMLVLEGAQGIGKSTGIRMLAGDDWFCDGLPGDLTKADAVQALQGAWIIELSELEGLSRSQVTTIKAFLSRQVDRARFAYERHAKDYSRQCIFIASTNEGAYLRDPTGGRRFWPVNVTAVDFRAIESNRDQIWAEAVHAFCQGENMILPRELWADAAREQEERHNFDPWEDTLRAYLDAEADPGPTAPLDRVHASYLLSEALDVSKDRQTSNISSRLRGIMENRLGWEYRRSVKVGGKNNSGYVRSESDKDNEESELPKE